MIVHNAEINILLVFNKQCLFTCKAIDCDTISKMPFCSGYLTKIKFKEALEMYCTGHTVVLPEIWISSVAVFRGLGINFQLVSSVDRLRRLDIP